MSGPGQGRARMQFPEHPFWDFALDVYGAEGVSAACLNLQERHGIDVNLMLFCVWLGHSGRGAASEAEVLAALAASDKWQRNVVQGLRLIRRGLKAGFAEVPADLRDALRAEIQRTEIDAEHLEQLLIAGAVDRPVTRAGAPVEARAGDAAQNVRKYMAAVEARLEPRDLVDFAHILGKAFPGLSPDRALDAAEVLV